MSEVRHLKKCIRENIKHITENPLNNIEQLESLQRFCGWVRNDAERVIKIWNKNK